MIRICSILTMTLGGMIYVLWRPDSLNMFSWFSAMGMGAPVATMRHWAAPYTAILPSWTYMSLPQALWLFSGCLAVHSVWREPRCRQEQCWMAVVLLLAAGGELGQAVGIVEGVFDVTDLALIVVAFLAALTIAFASGRHIETKRAAI